VKWIATLMMTTSAIAIQFIALPGWIQLSVPLVMGAVATWLWLQPENAA
jgi:hypothetical protein